MYLCKDLSSVLAQIHFCLCDYPHTRHPPNAFVDTRTPDILPMLMCIHAHQTSSQCLCAYPHTRPPPNAYVSTRTADILPRIHNCCHHSSLSHSNSTSSMYAHEFLVTFFRGLECNTLEKFVADTPSVLQANQVCCRYTKFVAGTPSLLPAHQLCCRHTKCVAAHQVCCRHTKCVAGTQVCKLYERRYILH